LRIFYATTGEFAAGGQLNLLTHVTTLRAQGRDARLLFIDNRGWSAPHFPPGVELPPWQADAAGLTAEDVVVVGEMFGAAALAVAASPARKLIHNQNPFYSFEAFRDVASIEAWGCEGILCASGFIADWLRAAGWTRPLWVVRPFVDAAFHGDIAAERAPWIVYMPRKRPAEARLIRGLLNSRRPDLSDVAWKMVAGVSRAECAGVLKASDLFLSLSFNEGLGLPPLEAMAAGALVVGFHGHGGREYATPENGDWFDDGDHAGIAGALAARLDAVRSGDRLIDRRQTAARTAAAFTQEIFEAQLKAAWDAIL
jgi:hypothetical protein